MKTNVSKLFALFAATALLFSCTLSVGQSRRKTTVRGSRNLITKTFQPGQFSRIDASGMYDIDIYQVEDNPRVEITTSDNIMEFVQLDAKNAVLNIGLDGKHRYDIKKIQVKVYAKSLEGLIIRGAADVSITHGLMTRALDLEVNGAGDLRLEGIDASEDVKVEINGAGSVHARKMAADNLILQVDGAGSVDVKEIESEKVTVTIRGAGNAVLSGKTGTAVLKVGGVGSINATQLKADNYDIDKSGIGSIKH